MFNIIKYSIRKLVRKIFKDLYDDIANVKQLANNTCEVIDNIKQLTNNTHENVAELKQLIDVTHNTIDGQFTEIRGALEVLRDISNTICANVERSVGYMDALAFHHLDKRDYISLFTYWSEPWRAWFKKYNKSEQNQFEAALLQGLDPESRDLIDHHIFLNKELLPHTKDFQSILYKNDMVWTQRDLIRMRQQKTADIPKEFSMFNEHEALREMPLPLFSISDAYGLRSFPENVIDRIRGKDVIDGGAWIGDSSLSFVCEGARRVYAFEPNPENLSLLQTVASLEPNHTIEVVAKGLSDTSTRARFQSYYKNDLGGGLVGQYAETSDFREHEIETVSIDEFVAAGALDVGLIKLDVEGMEHRVIAGALNTIQKFRPLIICAIYHSPRDFFLIKPMIENLNIDYNFCIRRLDFSNPCTDLYLLCWPRCSAKKEIEEKQ